MIEEHIKFNEEPKPFVYTQTNFYGANYHSTAWATKTEDQKKAWVALINSEYLKAIGLCKIGDHVNLKTNQACVVEIARFETDPEKVISYQGMPCVLKGIIRTWQNPNEISYALSEINWDTVISKQPLLVDANDDC